MYTFPEASSWSYKDCSIMYKQQKKGKKKKMLINSLKNSKSSLLLLVFVYSPGEENYRTFAMKQRENKPA